MSRRPTTTAARQTGIPRVTSQASIAMPPPNRVPAARPPSQSSTARGTGAGAGLGGSGGKEEGPSRAASPRKTSVRRAPGASTAGAGSGGRTEGGETNIQVVVRCRGRSPQELAAASPVITTTEGALAKAITIETTPMASSSMASFTTAASYGGSHAPSTKTYPFDRVFGPEADQTMVFKEVAEGMLDEVLAGYNCTIFAYGQTGTGKTFTMQGDLELSPLSAPKTEAGIVPRVLHRLFSLLESSANTEFTVRCSYVELYNEELRDLLATDYSPVSAGDKQPMAMGGAQQGGGLKLYEDGKKGVMIQGLEETGVRTLKDALGLLNKGCQRRQVAETKMNTESSRSHTIFSITVHVKEASLANGGDDLLRIGKFNLVDLAGSEAIGRSGATDKRAREAGMINQSLLTLGRVISALTEKSSHIPYRESKLTRLLQDSLGGRTKTCIVATVSPTRSNMEETLSTLDYAIRAKSIRNRPEVNAHLTKSGVLKEYLGDIERLKAEVMAAREKNGIYVPEESWREMHEAQSKLKSDYDEAKMRASAATVELATKRKEFDQLSEQFLLTTSELESAREAERQLVAEMEEARREMEVTRQKLEEEGVVSKAFIQGEHRLAGVAEGLRDVALDSVKDVGGLFDKLARKAQVLGANADAATTFGSDMRTLSGELRAELDKLNAVQGRYGSDMSGSLDAYRLHAQKHAKKDLDRLDAAFASFCNLAAALTQTIEAGKADAEETGQQLMGVRDEVLAAVRQWTGELGERSEGLVREVTESHEEQVAVIGSVLESTADLVDAVINTAGEFVASERVAAEAARKAAHDASQAEIQRLRSQNQLLATLLSSEKAKTAHLRTELIGNLTNLIVGFTDSQEVSLSAALASVQAGNEAGVRDMEAFAALAGETLVEADARGERLRAELRVGEETGVKQRAAGVGALRDASEGVRMALGEYGQSMGREVKACEEKMEGVCERFGSVAGDASERAASRSDEQLSALQSIEREMQASVNKDKERIGKDLDGVENLATTLTAQNASVGKSYAKHHTAASSRLDAVLQSTATFLERGIAEDVPTGDTPRKKQWDVPTRWERVQPRDRLVEAFRQRRAAGEAEPEEEELGTELRSRDESVAFDGELGGEGSTPPISPRESEGEEGIERVLSSDSLGSTLGPHHGQVPPQQPQTRGIPLPSLSASQIGRGAGKRVVSASSGFGLGKRDEIREKGAMQMPPLGESGLNVPRRVRK